MRGIINEHSRDKIGRVTSFVRSFGYVRYARRKKRQFTTFLGERLALDYTSSFTLLLGLGRVVARFGRRRKTPLFHVRVEQKLRRLVLARRARLNLRRDAALFSRNLSPYRPISPALTSDLSGEPGSSLRRLYPSAFFTLPRLLIPFQPFKTSP